jgi:NDP-sugar pyrophosphorylase family protein
MLNIVIPMAGAGSRFLNAGYEQPKPLIRVGSKTMIELVIDNLRPNIPHKFIFICQSQHLSDFPLSEILKQKSPACEIVETAGLTEGAACTVLLAKNFICNTEKLMIANCDQYVDVDINHYLSEASRPQIDGMVMTMEAKEEKWSYVQKNNHNYVTRIAEKLVISDEATVGIYNFRHGGDFVSAASRMIAMNQRVNGEFYVAPVYNIMIEQGARIQPYHVGTLGVGMHGLGTPEDLNAFHLTAMGKRIAAK